MALESLPWSHGDFALEGFTSVWGRHQDVFPQVRSLSPSLLSLTFALSIYQSLSIHRSLLVISSWEIPCGLFSGYLQRSSSQNADEWLRLGGEGGGQVQLNLSTCQLISGQRVLLHVTGFAIFCLVRHKQWSACGVALIRLENCWIHKKKIITTVNFVFC